MKYISNNKVISVLATAMLVASAVSLPAFAETSAGIGVNANISASANDGGIHADIGAKVKSAVQVGVQRADQEITRRINALNALSARVNDMVKLSASEKASISSEIQAQITALNTLQAQIAADGSSNSTSSLKTDIQSITKSYRIFMLVIPQGAIEAASDRVLDVAGMLTTLSGKLQTRITAAQTAGADMSTSVSALADMNAKIADATTQANAAVSETANLQPDNGDKTIMASNTAALKDAHSKIQTAQRDLVTARGDAGTIIKALLALKISGSVSATGTAQ